MPPKIVKKGAFMSNIPYVAAIKQLALEKGLNEEIVFQIIESAIAAAYRKDYGKPGQHVTASIEPKTGAIQLWRVHRVVENEEAIENPTVDILPTEAKKIQKGAKVGDEIKIELPYHEDFGRIAAQTAKQVIIQRLREAERDVLYQEFKDKESQIINTVVQQIEAKTVIVGLGKTTGILLPSGQIPGEEYHVGKRLRVCIQEVEETVRGPRIIVSRSSEEFIRQLFIMEVPEMASNTVEIKSIAREPGARTKIAVWSDDDNIDPVGSAVGQRGARVQAILSEIGEEKVDIILHSTDTKENITNALSPAKIKKITLSKGTQTAKVEVEEDQLSLAIGRRGQNVRLASKLTGWEIDIVSKEGKTSKKDEIDPDDEKPNIDEPEENEKSSSKKSTDKK